MTGPNRTEIVIEGLKGRIHQLEGEYINMQNLVCLMVHKFGSPVIITTKDIEEMQSGNLIIHTDPVTQSVMITFDEETTSDTKTDKTQNPQGE